MRQPAVLLRVYHIQRPSKVFTSLDQTDMPSSWQYAFQVLLPQNSKLSMSHLCFRQKPRNLSRLDRPSSRSLTDISRFRPKTAPIRVDEETSTDHEKHYKIWKTHRQIFWQLNLEHNRTTQQYQGKLSRSDLHKNRSNMGKVRVKNPNTIISKVSRPIIGSTNF